MRTSRLSLPLAAFQLLVLFLCVTLPQQALAQKPVDPSCATGCVGTDVTPDGASVSVVANSSGNNVSFTVANTGTLSGNFLFTCSATGNVTCGTVTPASKVLAAGLETVVSVSFSAGAAGTGVITLTASGGTTDTGFYNVTVSSTGPPVVVLRNHNKDNVDRSLCLTSGAGEAAAWSCGDLVITHSMPGYSTMGRERTLTLIHNSATAYPRPAIAATITQPNSAPQTVVALVSIGGTLRDSAFFQGWTGGAKQIVIDLNGSVYSTGAYPVQLRVQNRYPSIFETVVNDTLLIVDRFNDEFGAGFGIAGVEQLFIDQPAGSGHILWVGGDGSAKLYRKLNATTWVAPKGAFQDTLTLASGVYTRNLQHNVKVMFSGSGVTLGRQTATINRAGQQTTFTWNAAGNRLTSIQVPPACGAACTYTLAYDVNGNLDYIQDPAGRKLDATFAANDGRLTSLTDPDGNSVVFGWDGNRRIISRKNRRGFTTAYEYSLGRPTGSRITKVTVPIGRAVGDNATAVTTFDSWNDKGLGLGTTLTTAVDTGLAFTKIFGPRSGVADDASFWVDRWGAPIKIVNPLGFTTTIDRADAAWPARVTRVIYPNQEVVVMTYGARANLTQVRDSTSHLGANGLPTKATTYTYSTSGTTQDSPIKVADSTSTATPIVTNYTYTAAGLTQQVTAPNGHLTTFGYNAQNQVNSITEASVPKWDQTTRTEPAANLVTSFNFNALGNDTNVVSPTGRKTRHVRDSFQRVSDEYDPAGHQVTYGYDQLNRPLTVTEHVGGSNLVTQTGYNIDVVASVTDPRGAPRSWQYDMAGRQIGETDDWSHTELRFYNAAGQLDSVRQRVFEGSTGAVIRYTYDAAGRRQKMAWPDRPFPPGSVPGDSVLYTYDNMDRMLTATTSGTVVNIPDTLSHPRKITRTYFARGELKSEVQSRANGTVGYRNTYSYDRLGRRMSYVLGTPANLNFSDSLAYTYKPTGELNSIRMRWRGDPATAPSDSAVFFWDALGRRDSVRYSNGAFVKFAYDGDGALRLVCGNDNVSNPSYADVLKFTYNNSAVDGEGLVTSTATTIPTSSLGCSSNTTLAYTQTNAYDGRHQLTTMTRSPGESHTYVYDASGNIDQDNQPVNPDFDYVMLAGHNQVERRVPSVGTITRYLYDANGARSFECSGTSGCDPSTLTYRKYYYDGLGRMVGTDEHPPQGTIVVAPEYDPQGRLVPAPDGNADFSYDGDDIVRTKSDSSTGNIWTFVHGPGVDDPLIAHMVQLNGQWTINLKKTAYFATDGQGRQYGVGDAAGNDMYLDGYFTVWGGKYASATLNAASFGADRSSSTSMNELSFFRNRFYDQQSGRWTQEDPIGVAGGVNLYQFNGNNPVSNTDPFGLWPDINWLNVATAAAQLLMHAGDILQDIKGMFNRPPAEVEAPLVKEGPAKPGSIVGEATDEIAEGLGKVAKGSERGVKVVQGGSRIAGNPKGISPGSSQVMRNGFRMPAPMIDIVPCSSCLEMQLRQFAPRPTEIY